MDQTRVTLLQRIRDRGDEASWQEFVMLYGPLIRGYAKRFGANDDEAEDAAQEVFRTIMRRIETFERHDRPGSFRRWLRKVTASKVRRMLVGKAQQPDGVGGSVNVELLKGVPDPSQDRDEVWEEEWRKRRAEAALSRVRKAVHAKTWLAFELFVLEDKTAKETARLAQMEVGMVYVSKSRVMQRLKRVAAELDEEE